MKENYGLRNAPCDHTEPRHLGMRKTSAKGKNCQKTLQKNREVTGQVLQQMACGLTECGGTVRDEAGGLAGLEGHGELPGLCTEGTGEPQQDC